MSLSTSSPKSPSPTSSSSSSSPSPSLSRTSTQNHTDHRIVVLAVLLGVMTVILIGIVIYITLRTKHRSSSDDRFSRPARRRILSPLDTGSGINPFASPTIKTPPHGYLHSPGSNMRIANRRPDGVWQFSDLSSPFTPRIISDLDLSPSSPTSTTRLESSEVKDEHRSSRPLPVPPPSLQQEQQRPVLVSPGRLKKDFGLEIGEGDEHLRSIGVDGLPPPAYVYEHGAES